MPHIAEYIIENGGSVETRTFSRKDVKANRYRGNLIFHVNHTHFVTAQADRGEWIVYDTNSGISKQSFEQLMRKVSFWQYLLVPGELDHAS